jgi:hypothetical protein
VGVSVGVSQAFLMAKLAESQLKTSKETPKTSSIADAIIFDRNELSAIFF